GGGRPRALAETRGAQPVGVDADADLRALLKRDCDLARRADGDVAEVAAAGARQLERGKCPDRTQAIDRRTRRDDGAVALERDPDGAGPGGDGGLVKVAGERARGRKGVSAVRAQR